MRSPSDEFFSLVPELAFSQAMAVTCASFPVPGGELHLLVLGRFAQVPAPDGYPCTPNGTTFGVEVVAYPCNEDGSDIDWDRRYEITGNDVTVAMSKLRYQLANGLLTLWNREGWLAAHEAEMAKVETFDWETVPETLR